MSAIACLYIQPTEAVCNACAELTPVVEPSADRVFMDWTGCGSVPRLAQRLAALLQSLDTSGSTDSSNSNSSNNNGTCNSSGTGNSNDTGTGNSNSSHTGIATDSGADGEIQLGATYHPPYDNTDSDTRSGSAHHPSPAYRLGVAPVRFVADVLASMEQQDNGAQRKSFSHNSVVMNITGGYLIDKQTLPAFIHTLPVTLLPDIDHETKETLEALAVKTLGQLHHVNQDLLRSHIGAVADKLLAWARGDDARPVAALYPPERLRQRIPVEAWTASGRDFSAHLRASVTAAIAPLTDQLQATGRAVAQLTVVGGGRRQTRTFTPPLTDANQVTRVAERMTKRLLTTLFNVRNPLSQNARHSDGRHPHDISNGRHTSALPHKHDVLNMRHTGALSHKHDAFNMRHAGVLSHKHVLSDELHTSDVDVLGALAHVGDVSHVSNPLLSLDDLMLEIVPTDIPQKQMSLWNQSLRRGARLNAALDAVRARFGDIIVRPAAPREAVARYEAMFRLYEFNGYS